MRKKSTTKRRRPATGSRPRSKPRKTTRKPATRKRPTGGSVSIIATEKFVSDLIVRGEARHPDPEGKLPSDATHVIERQPGGRAKVKRARFKLY
jgi:hypothetical protein